MAKHKKLDVAKQGKNIVWDLPFGLASVGIAFFTRSNKIILHPSQPAIAYGQCLRNTWIDDFNSNALIWHVLCSTCDFLKPA